MACKLPANPDSPRARPARERHQTAPPSRNRPHQRRRARWHGKRTRTKSRSPEHLRRWTSRPHCRINPRSTAHQHRAGSRKSRRQLARQRSRGRRRRTRTGEAHRRKGRNSRNDRRQHDRKDNSAGKAACTRRPERRNSQQALQPYCRSEPLPWRSARSRGSERAPPLAYPSELHKARTYGHGKRRARQ